MPPEVRGGKLYPMFTGLNSNLTRRGTRRYARILPVMVAIAAMMFVWLFGWGADYFQWFDPSGTVQLALFTSFILGIVCGYKTKS